MMSLASNDVTCCQMQLYNFVKTDQNSTKLCTRFVLRKINKNVIKTGLKFWSQVPFKHQYSKMNNLGQISMAIQ